MKNNQSNRREKYNSVLNEVPEASRKHKIRLYGFIAIITFSCISLFFSQFLVQNIFQSDMHKQIKGADLTAPTKPSTPDKLGYELFDTDTIKIEQ